MASATRTQTPPLMPDLPPSGGEARLLLRDVGWAGYQRLLAEHINCGPRMAYLDGSVEQMTTGPRHESLKKVLARMVDVLFMELAIPSFPLGSVTFNRPSTARGVEPDECYYLAGTTRVLDYLAGPTRTSEDALIDLDEAPPPDLVVEVELSSPLLDKLAIYAGLGVPELWRYDGRRFRILLLQPDGSYLDSPYSRAFPFLPVEGFAHHLGRYDARQEVRWTQEYRAWVRDVVAPLHRP